MSHAATYNPTVRTAQARSWRVSADCRCGHAGPVLLHRLQDNLLLRDLERRLRCTHCGNRRCRLVVDWGTARTEGERAAQARANRSIP